MSDSHVGIKIVVRILVYRFWLWPLCIIAGVLVSHLLTMIFPPMYQSSAIVQVRGQISTNHPQIIQPVMVYSALITSDTVLNPVLQIYPLIDRQTFVAKNLVVTVNTSSQSFQIQVTLPDATISAQVANRLAQAVATQQNTAIEAQYTRVLQLINQRIASEQKTIDHLNRQYAGASGGNVLSLLASQLQQQHTLQNADIAMQQAVSTEQTLYSNPLAVILSASVADQAITPWGSLPLGPVLVGAFVVGAFLVAGLLERSAGPIHGKYALQRQAALPVFGTLRWTRSLQTFIPLSELYENAPGYLEDCRILAADLLFHITSEDNRVHTLALTSVRSRAGTSSVAVQLATLLALSKRHVLLIDAHLSHPALHELMHMPNEAGLVMLLEGTREKVAVPETVTATREVDVIDILPLQAFIKATDIASLSFLPAGYYNKQTHATGLLDIDKMKQVLDAVAMQADFVIVDCPPLEHGDARVLATLCDQTLLVVDAARDHISQVVGAKNELLDLGIRLSGIVINRLGSWL